MAWQDWIAVIGEPGDNPIGEVFAGIGARDLSYSDFYPLTIETNLVKIIAWLLSWRSQIIAAREARRQGETPIPFSLEKPDVTVPGAPPLKRMSIIQQICIMQRHFVNVAHDLLCLHGQEVTEDLTDGGSGDVFLSLFKKYAFAKEEDNDQGYPELTSLLLLAANQSIEILDASGNRDVFLGNHVVDEDVP